MSGLLAMLLLFAPLPDGLGDEENKDQEKELLFRAIAQAMAAEFDGADLARVSRALRRVADEIDALTARSTPATEQPELPMGDSDAGILAYLLERYDTDGNGAVEMSEYGRGKDRFLELDGNHDGVVDDKDVFGGFLSGGEMQGMLTSMTLTRFFNADDNGEELRWDEMIDTFNANDTDQDGALTREEFKVLADARPVEVASSILERIAGGLGNEGRQRGVDDMLADPFARLALLGDSEDPEVIAKEALLEYFDEHDEDLDEILDSSDLFGGGGGGSVFGGLFGSPVLAEVEAYDGSLRGPGVAKGRPAPDFTLKSLGDGPAVTLSAFRDKKPVALIFGSYT